MTGSLVRASWGVVTRPPVLVPAGAAALVVFATAPFLDGGNAHLVRIGVATMLACALAATADDPACDVAAASPHPRRVRCGTRLLLGLALVVPVAALSLALTEQQVGPIRAGDSAVQMLAFLAVGPAIGFAVWAWGDMAQPTYPAMAGVVCFALSLQLLPTTWSVINVQPSGPPSEAAVFRWFALVCLGAAIMASAWRDPQAIYGPRSAAGMTATPSARR